MERAKSLARIYHKNHRQYAKAKTLTATIPTMLSKKPNRTISHTLIPPFSKTMALGGVEIGIIKEKLAQIVIASIVIVGSSATKNDCVAV